MATQEKLQKSLDGLKNLSKSTKNSADISKKKEKLQYCYTITEAIANPAIKVSSNFHVLLGSTVEVFLLLCDDDDPDIRMTSEECLNRIIRSSNGYIGKIQIELHKEIKKNGSARPLRIALGLFSLLAHNIRPHKGKPYVANLFPSLIKIAGRKEELVHETLANSLPKIMKALGCFTTENEIKALLKAFLVNVSNDSSVIRRTTTNCILSICTNCKNPSVFMMYCFNNLLDILVPVNAEHFTSQILGVLSCIKILIPSIFSFNIDTNFLVKNNMQEKLLQIFELCLYYTSHKDHNIANISLELLKVILECPSEGLRKQLLIAKGLGSHRIFSIDKSRILSNRSSSQLSVATTTNTDDNLFSDSDLTETLQSDVEKWIDDSKFSMMNIGFAKTKEKSQSLDKMNRFDGDMTKNSDFGYGESNKFNKDGFMGKKKAHSIEKTLDIMDYSEHSSENSYNEVDEKSSNIDEAIREIEIGNILDEVPVEYCIRLISKQFLLDGSGSYISEKKVRVSVKFLALSCLSTLLGLQPSGIFMHLDKTYCLNSKKVSNQRICDVLLYRNHPDPQLRGAVRSMLGHFFKVVSNLCEEPYDKWLDVKSGVELNNDSFKSQNLVKIFIEGLNDESATCVRQTLLALDINLRYLLESQQSNLVMSVLNILPQLSSNPYWLVKVSLCELVSKIDYITVYYVTENNDFQQKVLHNILFSLLNDTDQRVRTSAATAIVKIIPRLFYPEYLNEETLISKAILDVKKISRSCKYSELDTNINKKHFINHMPFPFNNISVNPCKQIDFSLSKIVSKLSNFVLTAVSKDFLSGCVEALCLLAGKYPCTVYKNSWTTMDFLICEELKTPDLLKFSLNFLTNSSQVYGLQTHIDLLKLTTNLYAGNSLAILKPSNPEETTSSWSMYSNTAFALISDDFLHHTIKLLCIFHHILNDLTPVHPHAKPILPNLPNTANLSPLKRRKSDLDKKSLSLKLDKDEKVEKKDIKMNYLGLFVQSDHYMKIYETIKASFVNYKISLDVASSKTFLDLLNLTLKALSVILEVGSLAEFERLAEEILGYFRSTFVVDAPATVECVQQLLKCLFGTNLTANIAEFPLTKRDEKNRSDGFFRNVFQRPLNDVSLFFRVFGNVSRHDFVDDGSVIGFLHRTKAKRRSVILTRTSDKILANYIRIFEPMVIKSLKQYTITSSVDLQCQVLQLLSQLIQLRVNYCLLDSEQVFIGFVLKQFEFIEEGQIPSVERLIPKIFQFLVQLSYSKQHSKSIIGVPKIIQLCDGLMASGQPAATHCIPALEPIVEDIFLTRNKANTIDYKELETTREVVLSMLLRLCENTKVLDLVSLILEESNIEKWYEWSNMVFQVILPMLKQNKLKLDNADALVAVKRFILALNPDVFKPYDQIIVMFFQELPDANADSTIFRNWFSKIDILFLLIIPVKENALLAKINRLKSEFSPGCIFENVKTKADPLNVNNNADTFQDISSEVIFVKYLFRILHVSSGRCLIEIERAEEGFVVEQLFGFLVHCCYLFHKADHPNISKMAVDILTRRCENELQETNNNFSRLATFYPVLSAHWCNLMNLINLKSYHQLENTIVKNPAMNLEVTRIASTIARCDFLSINAPDFNDFSSFLKTNAELLIDLHNELPVFEFISYAHLTPERSQLFIENVSEIIRKGKCSSIYKMKTLQCIEKCHQSQIGAVLKLLIPDMIKFHHSTVSRTATNLASRKIEILLTLSTEEVTSQLSKEDFIQIQNDLIDLNIVKKSETLVGLLNKLSLQCYGLQPIKFEKRRTVNPEDIKELKVDRKWFLNQLQSKYDDSSIGRFIAELLNKVEYNEIVSFMSSSGFNKHILRDCLRLGMMNLSKLRANEGCDLLRASIDCLLKDVSNVVSKITTPHQVFSPVERPSSDPETLYTAKMTELFENEEVSNLLYSIAKCVPLFSENILRDPYYKICDNNLEDLVKYSVLCLEYVHYLETQNRDFRVHLTDICLTASDCILRNVVTSYFLGVDSNVTWLCSSINSLYSLVNALLRSDNPLLDVPKYSLNKDSSPVQATHQIYKLTCWFFDLKSINTTKIPDFLFDRIKSLTVCLARLPLVNSYALIPRRAWKIGWQPDRMEGEFGTVVTALPIDILQDTDVLQEYIYRINLLGWTSRQQFEETWMCLLSVLCATRDDLDSFELNDILYASSLAMKSITTLLLETLTYPDVGDPNVSRLMHISRNNPIDEMSISVQKLKKIQNYLQLNYQNSSHNSDNYRINNVFNLRNLEKCSENYSCGQVSVKYMLIATNSIEETQEILPVLETHRHRMKRLEGMGLDVNSCLQFLIDYYSQLMQVKSKTHIRILHELVKSTTMISDLFTDKSQFSWMLQAFLQLSKTHNSEDEFLHQYLVIGICKAVAVLSPELDTYEQLKKLLVQYLKSPYLTSRMASLYGILYILEGCKLSNIKFGGISEEMQLILPCAVEYVQLNLSPFYDALRKSQEHISLVWSLAFYLVENIDEIHMEQNFVTTVLSTAFSNLKSKNPSWFHAILMKGLERLLIIKKNVLLESFGKQYLKLALDKMKSDNPTVSILGTQLLLSYMYIDCGDHLQSVQTQSNVPTSPEHLVQTIETISAIFERIKKGYVCEVELLCAVLPNVLDDFFTPADILTKVIGEFLSSQQPHPKLLSKVVFQVFQSAIQQNQLSLLQDWVVFSLSNFTQSFSIGMATWCLTCFFVSASSNDWLRSYFPYVQTRVGRYEYEDKYMLCIAGANFYNSLTNEKQRQTFVDNFAKVRNQPDTPFNDLLLSL
ncbi:unnamed protein product [Phyllotreta striolata]|uniref:Huntingtin n=1 Tax=Phyllotreta striolata TaxID=444603 RepID=A0A9N9TW07_PHYSR|nr:unnamed protein product [Phyllotreta striolata]